MTNTCLRCQTVFKVTDDDLVFYDKVSPVFAAIKSPLTPLSKGGGVPIPPPVHCPDCRMQQRMAFRNERRLFNDVCDLCGVDMISCYSPRLRSSSFGGQARQSFPVYCQPCWWSDKWNAEIYGRDFDFSKTFTEQMRALLAVAPRNALFVRNGENSTYNNYAINVKNCYLCFGATNNEDCYYCKFIPRSKNVVDCLGTYSSELCYETVYVDNCYHCLYGGYLRSCMDCYFSEELAGCTNCIACFGLRQQEYCVLNEYVGKKRFEEIKGRLFPLTHAKIADIRRRFYELKKNLPYPHAHLYNTDNCTGDWVIDCKNCVDCFDIKGSEDCKRIAFSPNSDNSHDCTFTAPDGVHFSYQVCAGLGYGQLFNFLCWRTNHTLYSIGCANSNHLFACASMNRAEYCILNKRYSKEEYRRLAVRIASHMTDTGEWGKFFDPQLSAFGFNETVSYEYFPMTKEEALAKGFHWSDYEAPLPDVGTQDIPSLQVSAVDAPDSVLDEAFLCEVSGKPFRIIKPELRFLRENGLPLPRRHPDVRHTDRLKRQYPKHLHDRPCSSCSKTMSTPYIPERQEKVFCETCYLKEVY